MAADPRLIHAIRGPITLITLGVLFTLDHFTPYSFGQTWPVLLIVFGLLSLLRRNAGPMPMPPGPPPGTPWGTPPSATPWPPPPPPEAGYSTGGYRQSTYGSTSPSSGTGPSGPEGGPQ